MKDFQTTYNLYNYYSTEAVKYDGLKDERSETKRRQFMWLARLLERVLKEMAEETLHRVADTVRAGALSLQQASEFFGFDETQIQALL